MASATTNQLLWDVSRGRHVPVLLHSLSALNAPSSPRINTVCWSTEGLTRPVHVWARSAYLAPPVRWPSFGLRLGVVSSDVRCLILAGVCRAFDFFLPSLVLVFSLSRSCVWSCSRSLVLLKGDEPGRPEPSSLGAGRRGRVRGPPQPHQVCYESCKRRRNGVTGCGICAVRWAWKRGGVTTAVSTTSYRERRFSRLEIRPSPGQGHARLVALKHVSYPRRSVLQVQGALP